MANYQTGYGHGDVVGVPFDFYSGAVALPTGVVITMQTAILVLVPAGAISATVTLPLNPVDGAYAEVNNVGAGGTVTLTGNLAANTGDSIVGTALASLASNASAAYRYTLNGFQPASGAAVNPRSWVRVK